MSNADDKDFNINKTKKISFYIQTLILLTFYQSKGFLFSL